MNSDNKIVDLFLSFQRTIQNDMIALARKMTQIMHQMTEYTRGEGQLKTNKGANAFFT